MPSICVFTDVMSSRCLKGFLWPLAITSFSLGVELLTIFFFKGNVVKYLNVMYVTIMWLMIHVNISKGWSKSPVYCLFKNKKQADQCLFQWKTESDQYYVLSVPSGLTPWKMWHCRCCMWKHHITGRGLINTTHTCKRPKNSYIIVSGRQINRRK